MQQLSVSVDCEPLQGQELDPAMMANADSSQQDSGMTLIAVLLCTLMRGTKLQEAKVRCGISAVPVHTRSFCGAPLRHRQGAPVLLLPALGVRCCE